MASSGERSSLPRSRISSQSGSLSPSATLPQPSKHSVLEQLASSQPANQMQEAGLSVSCMAFTAIFHENTHLRCRGRDSNQVAEENSPTLASGRPKRASAQSDEPQHLLAINYCMSDQPLLIDQDSIHSAQLAQSFKPHPSLIRLQQGKGKKMPTLPADLGWRRKTSRGFSPVVSQPKARLAYQATHANAST